MAREKEDLEHSKQIEGRMHEVEKQARAIDPNGLIDRFRSLPKRRLTEMEKQVIFILVEKAKIQRERSITIMNKGFMVFLAFIIIAAGAKMYGLIQDIYITVLFFLGIIVLIVSTMAYQSTMTQEEAVLDKLLDGFLR